MSRMAVTTSSPAKNKRIRLRSTRKSCVNDSSPKSLTTMIQRSPNPERIKPGRSVLYWQQAEPLQLRQICTHLGVGEQHQDRLHGPSPIVLDRLDRLEADRRLVQRVIERQQFLD